MKAFARSLVAAQVVLVSACMSQSDPVETSASNTAVPTASSTTTTSSPTELPIDVDDPDEPGPVPESIAISPDWAPLDHGPLEVRRPAMFAWTGEEIVIWGGEPFGQGADLGGGAAYRPDTDTWRTLSEGPLPPSAEASWVWTGDELVIWTYSGAAAAWQPTTNSWRTIDDWPLQFSFYRRAVWTGEEILDADRGLFIDPQTGASRPIADPPNIHSRGSVVWADGYLVTVTSDGAYNQQADAWVEMPDSGLTPDATSGTWTGSEVVAVDYEMSAAGYDAGTNTWTSYPPLPLRFLECAPTAHTLSGQAVAEHCSGIGIWDPQRSAWIPLATPHPQQTTLLISTGEALYAWGDGFYRLDTHPPTQPKRLAVGGSLLDLPEGWELVTTTGGPTITVQLEDTQGDTCTVHATDDDARTVLASYVTDEPVMVELTPQVGGKPVDALQIPAGQLDNAYHLVWASGPYEVLDVACTTLDATHVVATHIWNLYQ